MFANAHALGADTEAEIESHRATGLTYLKKSISHYKWRNYLLLGGLLCYLATKVWASDHDSGWILVH